MNSPAYLRALYLVAAAYDGLLGLAFLVAGPALYRAVGIAPPNHWGYVHFAASLLVVFGLLFLRVARDPVRYRDLIPFGILLKFSYVGTITWHWLGDGLPDIWKYFAVADVVFAVLFLASLRAVKAGGKQGCR